MSGPESKKSASEGKANARRERLKSALRANLSRRKQAGHTQQERSRSGTSDPDTGASEAKD